MVLGTSRCYLANCSPSFSLPRTLAPDLSMLSTEKCEPLRDESKQVHGENALCLQLENCADHMTAHRFLAFVNACQLASDCSLDITAIDHSSYGPTMVTHQPRFLWGHYQEELTEEAVLFAAEHYELVEAHLGQERFNRFANALRLHSNGMITENGELALLAFIAAIESLFSVSTQELSFRLSMTVAKILGTDEPSQRDYFRRSKALYGIRSKLAHGAKIATSEEQSAIQIGEYWTPEAEELSRACLRQALGRNLVDIVSSNKRLEAFVSALPFATNLDDAAKIARG